MRPKEVENHHLPFWWMNGVQAVRIKDPKSIMTGKKK